MTDRGRVGEGVGQDPPHTSTYPRVTPGERACVHAGPPGSVEYGTPGTETQLVVAGSRRGRRRRGHSCTS